MNELKDLSTPISQLYFDINESNKRIRQHSLELALGHVDLMDFLGKPTGEIVIELADAFSKFIINGKD